MSKVLDWIHSHSWAIQPEWLERIVSIANRDFSDLEAVATKQAEYMKDSAKTSIQDGVAIVDIHGPIFARASFFQAISGATDVEMLGTDIGAALENPNVHSILLHIDSPGGEVSGVSELAAIIRKANGRKPVVAFVQGIGASAAYWLAAAAGKVYMADSALVGSIGVVMTIQKTKDREGTKTYEFVSTSAPNKRPDLESDTGRSAIQSLVDSLGTVFQENVAKYRGVSLDTVQKNFGQGGMFVGKEAVERNMADKVTTLENTLQELVQDNFGKITGGIYMRPDELKAKHPETYAAIFDAGKAEGTASKEAATKEAMAQAAATERERIQAIESIKAPGYEKIVQENKFKPEMTKDKVSVLVLDAQEATRAKALNDRTTEGTELADKTKGTGSDATAEEEAQKNLIAVAAKAASSK